MPYLIKRKMSFDETWKHIIQYQGEQFVTIRGKSFTYKVEGNYVINNRTYFPLHKNNFRNAWTEMPVEGPGSFSKSIMGPSYTWALLNDERIRK